MKSDKLQDAIGMVDPDLVQKAEIKNNTKKSKIITIKWVAPVAAVVAICIAIGVFFPFGNNPLKPNIGSVSNSIIIAEYRAQYPIMTQYDENNHAQWVEDRRKQLDYSGAGKNLDSFFQSTISEFLNDDNGENKLYSPVNVYMALAMVAEITDSDSRQQILDLLNADSIDALRKQAHSIWNANYCDDGITKSVLASSLWLSDDMEYNEQTIQNLLNNYYASAFSGKMGSDEYSKLYKEWLNEQTGGLLKDQIDKKALDERTIMAIATTLYFKAQWDSFFSKSNTTKSQFNSVDGVVTCDFMNQTISNGEYYWGDNFSAVRKSINGSGHMYFILADKDISTQSLLSDKEAVNFMTNSANWKNTKNLQINLSLPKFDVNSQIDLIGGLKNLGVTDCFNSAKSDFSPLISQVDEVYIDKASHGVRVSIDEEGVTGAAYTEISLLNGATPPKEEIDFVVDRPFIFVVTGADNLPLFVGVVNQM